jgi:tetratricopeptide (TPR) repeat protein
VDFTKQLQKADEALRRRNPDFAIELYRQLLDIAPDLGEARAGLRQALKAREALKGGGSKLFRALTGAGPLVAAKGLAKAGRHDAAVKQYEAYLDSSPFDEEANLLLGVSLESAGHVNSARAVYEFVAVIAPRNAEGLKRAGAMTARLGDPQKALEYYERALQADPRDQDCIKARKDLAAELALRGASSRQVEHSRELIKDKGEARAIERSQRLQLTEEELREELAQLEARHADEPSVATSRRLSEVHEKLGDAEEALSWAERALSMDREGFEVACRVGDLRTKLLKKAVARAGKEGDEALAGQLERELHEFEVRDWTRRVELRPADATLRLQLGRRLVRAGEVDLAMPELQRAAVDPRCSRDAHALLGECFQKKGYLDLARKEYEKALGPLGTVLDERAKEILYTLGAIAEEAGEAAQARTHYSRVFEADVGYKDVAAKMERLR